ADLEVRQRELLDEGLGHWLGPLADVFDRSAFDFRRGFPEGMVVHPRALLEWAEELERRVPLAGLVLDDAFDDAALEALASCPHGGWVIELGWDNGEVTDAGFGALAGSANLPRLAALWASAGTITDLGVRALATSPHRSALRGLSLQNISLTPAA